MASIINERDKLLQATSPRVISTDQNYISILTNSSIFTRVAGGIQPTSIILTPKLNGKLKGISQLTWSVNPNTIVYTVDNATKAVTLPSSSVTIGTPVTFTATLNYLGTNYSASIVVNGLTDSVSFYLSKDSVNINTLNDGSNGDYTLATSTATIIIGNYDDSDNWTYSWNVPVTVVANGANTKTISITNMPTVDSAVLTLTATKTGWPTLTKNFTIAKSKEGQPGQIAPLVTLTSTTQTFITAKNTGEITPETAVFTATPTNIISPSYVWRVNGTEVQSGASDTYTLQKFSGSPKLVKVTATSGDGTIIVSDQASIFNLRDGDDALQAGLANESQTVSATSAGVVTSGLPATSQLILVRGAAILTYSTDGVVYGKVSETNLTSTINATTGIITVTAVSANTASATYRTGVGSTTTVTQNISYLVNNNTGSSLAQWQVRFSTLTSIPQLGDIITATSTGTLLGGATLALNTLDKTLSFSKSVAGKDGGIFSITNTGTVFNKTKDGTINPQAGLQLSTSFTNLTNVTYQWSKQTDSVGTFTDITGATNSTYTVPYTHFENNTTNTYRCSITATFNGIANSIFNDQITVVRLDEGSDAISIILSNEAHVFPASNSGTVTNYSASGSTIKVFEGTNELVYDGIGNNDSSWKINSPVAGTVGNGSNGATNITVGTYTGSGNYVSIGNHSGVPDGVDVSTIIYNITGRRSNSSSFSINKQQSFTKSKAGSLNPFIRKTANYLAGNGDRIIADSSGGPFTITLPANPTLGYSVVITDGSNFVLNNVTINRNGSTIKGFSDNVLLDIYSSTFEFIYDGNTWQFTSTVGPKGDQGVDAQLLSISTSAYAFIFDSRTATTDATPTSITFTAEKQNITGTPTFTAIAYDENNAVLGNVTLTGSGDSATMSQANFIAVTGDTRVRYVRVTVSLGSISDTVTIVRGDNGSDTITHIMTNESHPVPADTNGVVASYTGAITYGAIFRGLVNETMDWTLTKADSSGLTTTLTGPTRVSTTGTITNISGSGPWYATISDMSSVTGLAVGNQLSAIHNSTGRLFTDTAQGIGPTSIAVTSVNTVNKSITYSVTGGGPPIAGPIGGVAIGGNIYTLTVTNLTSNQDVATSTVTASLSGYTSVSKVFSIVKNKAGLQGTQGVLGDQGDAAGIFRIINAGSSFVLNSAGTSITPTTITLTTAYLNLTGTIAYQWYKKSGATWTAISGATNSSYNVPNTDYSVSINNNSYKCEITGTLNATSITLSDEATIPRLQDGSDAISVILSNDSHTLPASADGTVTSYVNSGTTIRVYQGSTELTYDGLGTSAGTWKIASPAAGTAATNITVGSYTDSGTYATVGSHSGVSAGVDTSSILYTVSGTRTDGLKTFSNISKLQTFAKSKTGSGGSQGIGGIQGTTGNAAGSFSITNSGSVFRSSTTNDITPSGGITLTTNYTNLTGTISYAWSKQTNSTGTFSTISGATSSSYTVPVSDYTSYFTNTYRCQISGTLNGISTNLTDDITIPKLQDGSESLTVVVGNESHNLTANSSGAITSYANSGTTIKVYEGGTQLNYDGQGTSNGTWTIASPAAATVGNGSNGATNITVGTYTATQEGSNTYLTVGIHSGVANGVDSSLITYSISGKRQNGTAFSGIIKTQTFAKSKNGSDGIQGIGGVNGSNAAIFTIDTAGASFRLDSAGTTTTPSGGITLTTSYLNLTGTISYAWSKQTNSTGTFSTISGATSSSYTVPVSDYTSSVNTNTYRCTITGTLNGTSTNLTDDITIPRLKDGINGLTVILSNESHPLPASTAGVVSSYVNSGTTIKVFEGSTELTYDGTGTTAGTWKITSPAAGTAGNGSNGATNITVGTYTDSGTFLTIGVHSGVADGTDTSIITYTIQGTRQNGEAFSGLTKSQTFSKSRTGSGGSQGTTGNSVQGTGGSQGSSGSQGTGGTSITGPRVASGFIYYSLSSASAPGVPTASSFNFSTGVFGTITANWNTTFTAPNPATTIGTQAGTLLWAVRYTVSEDTYGGTQTVTISAVFNWLNLNGLVTFSNVADTSTTTFINGGKITTDSITLNALKTGTDTVSTGRTFGLGTGSNVNIGGTAYPSTGYFEIDGVAGPATALSTVAKNASDIVSLVNWVGASGWCSLFSGHGVSETFNNKYKNYVTLCTPGIAGEFRNTTISQNNNNPQSLGYIAGEYEAGVFDYRRDTATNTNITSRAVIGGINCAGEMYGFAKAYNFVTRNRVLLAPAPDAGVGTFAFQAMKFYDNSTDIRNYSELSNLTFSGYFESRNTSGVATSTIQLATGGYASYVNVGTTGPFTGSHDALIDYSEHFELGDIVVDVEVVAKNGVSDVITKVRVADTSGDTRVVGVVSNKTDKTVHMPAAMSKSYLVDGKKFTTIDPQYMEVYNSTQMIIINSLGEGQINVCGLGGDIQAGDYIISSTLRGKGMKQSDNVMHSYTVAKARESVTFSNPEEVKQIACIYHCG